MPKPEIIQVNPVFGYTEEEINSTKKPPNRKKIVNEIMYFQKNV